MPPAKKKTSATRSAKKASIQEQTKAANDAALAPKRKGEKDRLHAEFQAPRKARGASKPAQRVNTPEPTTKRAVGPKNDDNDLAAIRGKLAVAEMVAEGRKIRENAQPYQPEVKSIPGPKYIPSETQGKAIGSAIRRDTENENLVVIDVATGGEVANPAELVLKDDIDGYYSHSTIKSLASCSAAVYYRKSGVKMTPAYALERGSAVHNALEQYQKFGKNPLKVFEDNWQLMVLDKMSEMKPSDQEKVRLGYEESKRMLQDFMVENGELIEARSKPEDAEVEFSIVVRINVEGGSFARRIYGKMDWVLWSSDKKSYTILDYKTSAQAPPDSELDRDTQFAIYQLAGTELYGFPPEKMVFYYLKGQHICGGRFTKDHPRPTTPAGMEKCLQFAFDIPVKSGKEIQAMIDTYYGPVILAHEIGLITKNLSDPRKCVSMCGYKDHCDKVTSLPLPRFARLDNS